MASKHIFKHSSKNINNLPADLCILERLILLCNVPTVDEIKSLADSILSEHENPKFQSLSDKEKERHFSSIFFSHISDFARILEKLNNLNDFIISKNSPKYPDISDSFDMSKMAFIIPYFRRTSTVEHMLRTCFIFRKIDHESGDDSYVNELHKTIEGEIQLLKNFFLTKLTNLTDELIIKYALADKNLDWAERLNLEWFDKKISAPKKYTPEIISYGLEKKQEGWSWPDIAKELNNIYPGKNFTANGLSTQFSRISKKTKS